MIKNDTINISNGDYNIIDRANHSLFHSNSPHVPGQATPILYTIARAQEKIVTFTMVDLHYIHNGKQIHITFAEYNACEFLHCKIQC